MIEAQGLTKFYGDKCAISDLNFEITDGEIVGIVGLNGAGKTTTLRILACLLLPSAGKVTINKLSVSDSPHEIRKQVGFLPEVPPLYTEMTVEAFLSFAGELRGMSRADVRPRVEEVLEVTATKDVRAEVIGNLSHGYRQRVGIGQAIVHKPALLILDEPISGLDPVQISEMRQMIRGLKGQHTILVSSHILPEISQTCDRIMMIDKGRIVASGTEEQLTGKLTGGQHLLVTVRGERDKVVTLLNGVSGVTSCAVDTNLLGVPYRGGSDAAAPLHHFDVQTREDCREAIARALVQAGFGLLQLRPAKTELESIFIQLTQDKKVSA
jgi:ABC-2 type transport system ATP-binding protein